MSATATGHYPHVACWHRPERMNTATESLMNLLNNWLHQSKAKMYLLLSFAFRISHFIIYSVSIDVQCVYVRMQLTSKSIQTLTFCYFAVELWRVQPYTRLAQYPPHSTPPIKCPPCMSARFLVPTRRTPADAYTHGILFIYIQTSKPTMFINFVIHFVCIACARG